MWKDGQEGGGYKTWNILSNKIFFVKIFKLSANTSIKNHIDDGYRFLILNVCFCFDKDLSFHADDRKGKILLYKPDIEVHGIENTLNKTVYAISLGIYRLWSK